MNAVGTGQVDGETLAVEVEPDRLKSLKIYVRQARDLVRPGSTAFRFVARDAGGAETASYDANFIAPEASR